MLKLNAAGCIYRGGRPVAAPDGQTTEDARARTIAGRILRAHNAVAPRGAAPLPAGP